ncbi:MAG: site-specific integrase [Bacteroidales bacterium]|nr:site-specific integrase [Bacteroidales bacterium]
MTSKQPVRLRQRKISNGLTSLYLDIYINGERSYEFLKLYLVEEHTRADREKNRETMRLAEAVRSQRVVDIQNGVFGFRNDRRASVGILSYFKSQWELRKETMSPNTSSVWGCTYLHLCEFCKTDVPLTDIDADWVKAYKMYLDTEALNNRTKRKSKVKIKQNTKLAYLTKLHACLRQAVRDGLLDRNPMDGVGYFKQAETAHVYLTLDEIRLFAAQPCRPEWKAERDAFLFSCLTGIRKSDILSMRWGDVTEENGFTRIIFRQHKTGGVEYLDITPHAVQFMGERGGDDQLVFKDFIYDADTAAHIQKIAKAAGINKKLTFHSARHSMAILMLELGEDLYTVSKLLGHRNIKTTQIYARIVDQKKQQAVNKIPEI